MRRNVIIAALLLPLPFAALPLVGVLFGVHESEGIVIDARMATEQRLPAYDSPATDDNPLAYGLADTSYDHCGGASTSRIEG